MNHIKLISLTLAAIFLVLAVPIFYHQDTKQILEQVPQAPVTNENFPGQYIVKSQTSTANQLKATIQY